MESTAAAAISSDQVKAHAAAVGLDLCGIAPAADFPELRYLREWLDLGYHGEMHYLARNADRRSDVRAVLPEARSVIMLGTIYNADRPYSTEVPDADAAAIARYAWGDDYHEVIGGRMTELLAVLEQLAGPFRAKAYVDTGPVQERVYAQYAGLGWIGKNTCLINREIGSWLFLGEIICTLRLEPDTQGLEQCGSCTRCLEACPTGALVEPGVLDSNRCLSYLTIELRSAIPEARRASIGGHIYGCDICQEVCPYNRPAPHSGDAPWQPRGGLDLPRMVDLWRRSDRDLRSLVKGSAMTRAKLVGLRRNLAVAIGNSGEAEALAALSEHDLDRPSVEDPMVQEHIEWALDEKNRAVRRGDGAECDGPVR